MELQYAVAVNPCLQGYEIALQKEGDPLLTLIGSTVPNIKVTFEVFEIPQVRLRLLTRIGSTRVLIATS